MASIPNFALDILNCPPSGSIKSIKYQAPSKLCVVQGAETLMCIDLKDFFIPVTDAQKTSFTLSGATISGIPLDQYLFDFCGLGGTSGAKFASFFFNYGSTVSSSSQFVQWAFSNELDGPLATLDATLIDNSGSTAGATGSDTSFVLNLSRDLSPVDGTYFSLTSSEAFALATDAGLKFWSVADGMINLNTFNSEIPSNDLTSIAYSPAGNLWIGTGSEGIINVSWNDSVFSFSQYTENNSSLLSDSINDLFFVNDSLAIATDQGISLLDTENNTWQNFSRTNVNEINDTSFNSVYIDTDYLIGAAENGVYVYDMTNSTWEVYNSSVSGWSFDNEVLRVISYDQEVFAITSEGIVTFTIGATSCDQINYPYGATSSYNYVIDINYVVGASGEDSLVIGSQPGGVAEYDILGATWSYSYIAPGGTSSNLMSSGVSKISVDSNYVYFVNDSGFGRFDTGATVVNTLPLSTQTSDILFSYPQDGTFPVALDQKIYIGFSKPVSSTVLQNHIVFKNMATGATLGYSLTSSNGGYFYEIEATSDFSYATTYNFIVESGLTSTDGKYFRQSVDSLFISHDKNPINGWRVAGKQLTLSGAEGSLVDSIIFRNLQTFDIPVNAMIAV